MKEYEIIDDWIQLTQGPYCGIIYKYGRVELIEEGDQLRIKFEYELKDKSIMDEHFIDYIGDILTELITDGIINNDIVYTGGTNG